MVPSDDAATFRSEHILNLVKYSGHKYARHKILGMARKIWFGDEATAEEMALSEGFFDPEIPHKPEWSRSPRSLAVHPDGSQVRVQFGTFFYTSVREGVFQISGGCIISLDANSLRDENSL